ncbi:hypothetical protein QJS10_CPB14g00286 [Acorus calamus]|uniref:Tetratricopeptide repeat protein 5 OB fold domain-containing protein n=1 Tax=Acorus calamus TaxID=4465 RepID=A0AAV9DEN3_ACOCL|nr:hypothetical protein QJS10_CPB14g00286 [Acorus calamus]
MSGGSAGDSTLSRAAEEAEELHRIRDTYFPANPEDKTSGSRPAPITLSASSTRSLQVKLNPSLGDAWLCLGHSIWKKGDLASAKNCFSLALSKGPNKKILCYLSMLERKLAQGKTIILEKDPDMNSNPDLYFNCAIANKYLENYERALTGFEAAALKDPGLNSGEEVQQIVTLLDRLIILSRSNTLVGGQSKGKRLKTLAASLAEAVVDSSHKKATISVLQEGLNNAFAVIGRVLLFIKHGATAPVFYLVCDSEQTCFVLSVYGLHVDAIKENDQVTILQPYYRVFDISWKDKVYQFKSIRVDFAEQIHVNGKSPAPYHVVRTSLLAQHKP